MLHENQAEEDKCLATTDATSHTSPSGQLLTTYNPLDTYCNSFNSQKTLPETLAPNSRALDFEDNSTYMQLQQQLAELKGRFNGIHKILIDHSEYESDLHEKKNGYKLLPIDHQNLGKDFSNKVQIIADIDEAIKQIEDEKKTNLDEVLQGKFQEYYLERHYGNLSCQFGNLQIQEKSQQSEMASEYINIESKVSHEKSSTPSKGNHILSKISQYESLIPESKLTYTEQFCQTVPYEIKIDVPNIIEVEIPIIVYKYKEVIVKIQDGSIVSNPGQNIDQIIDKYSAPYEELYSMAGEESNRKCCATIPQTPSITVAPSNMEGQTSNQPQSTEIQLAYSDFPQEDHLKLPLDSYAQIQSLISNSDRGDTERSYPPQNHQQQLNSGEAIFITEKVVSRSTIEKFEETERSLLEENIELKEYISALEQKLSEIEKQKEDIEKQSEKIAARLEQEIQQTEYFASKLEEMDIELMEEKISSLTHLNESKQRKIEMLNCELKKKSEIIAEMEREVESIREQMEMNETELNRKEEEINNLTKELEEKDLDLIQLNGCEENAIKYASETQITLKSQIESLQKEKNELKDNIKFYQQRMFNEGIGLQIDDASEIKVYIEQKEFQFALEIKETKEKYEKMITKCQEQIHDLKEKVQFTLKESQKRAKNMKVTYEQQKLNYCSQFQILVEEYNAELQSKDEEILTLKQNLTKLNMQLQNANKNTVDSCHSNELELQLMLERANKSIVFLQRQLSSERQQKTQLASRLVQLDQLVKIGAMFESKVY